LLSSEVKKAVQERFFSKLESKVTLHFFTIEFNCMYCGEIAQLYSELAELSPLLEVEVHDFERDRDAVRCFKIDAAPCTAIVGERDFGLRFYGIPAGYEFRSFLQAIVDASRGRTGLPDELRDRARAFRKPVELKVFVTPTCPHCPSMALAAFQLAVESDMVEAKVIEASEFPQLASKYGVMAVPKTIVNDVAGFEGAASASALVEFIEATLEES